MRYQGGKFRLSDKICPVIDRALLMYEGRYYEPFIGGMNILYKLRNVREAYCSDFSEGLAGMYLAVLSGWVPAETISEEEYKELRKLKKTDPISVFVSFACSFAARKWGGFAKSKTRSGLDRNFAKRGKDILMWKMSVIPDTTFFRECSYSLIDPKKPSVIYCDPPYKGTQGYKVKSAFDSELFFTWCENMVSLGHCVLVSERSCPDHWDLVLSDKTVGSMVLKTSKTFKDNLYSVRVKR